MKYKDIEAQWLANKALGLRTLVEVFDKEKFVAGAKSSYKKEIYGLSPRIPIILEIYDIGNCWVSYEMTEDTAKHFSRRWSGGMMESSGRLDSVRFCAGGSLDMELII